LIHPHNWRTYFSAACLLVFAMGILGYGQAARGTNVASAKAAPPLLPGVVVEKVSKKSGAEKAGLREGDVLLGWSRGDEHGKIESPFDISWLDVEQRPRGIVTLQGLRGVQRKAWSLQQIDWQIRVRPNFAPAMLMRYEEVSKTAKVAISAKSAMLLEIANSPSTVQPCWLRPWLIVRATQQFEVEGRWKQAGEAHEYASKQASCHSRIQGETLLAWADFLTSRGKFNEAENVYQQAFLLLNHESNSPSLNVAHVFTSLGFLHQTQYDWETAADYYRRALQIQEQIAPGQLDVVITLEYLVGTFAGSGNLSQAEDLIEKIRIIEDRLPVNYLTGRSFEAQGMIDFYRGNLAKAEMDYRRALNTFRSIDSHHSEIDTVIQALGVVSWWRGDLETAKRRFNLALKIRQRQDPEGLSFAETLISLGETLSEIGDVEGSRNRIHRALLIGQKLDPQGHLVAQCFDQLGILAQTSGKLALAESYFQQAITIEQKEGLKSFELAADLNDLGGVSVRMGNIAKAAGYFARALAIEEIVCPGSRIHAQALAGLAAIARQGQDLEGAEEFYRQALVALDSQTTRLGGFQDAGSAFRLQNESYYTSFAFLLIARKKPEAAFEVLERSRARALLEMMAAAHVDVRKGVDPSLLEREHSLRADINAKSERRIQLMREKQPDQAVKSAEKELADLSSQYQDVEGQIRASSPAYAALTQPQPLTAKEVQTQLLDPNTLLLEYSLGEERSYVFAVTPDSLRAFELPKRAEVEKASGRVYSLLTARNRTVKAETPAQQQVRLAKAQADYPHAAAELSKMILGPVASQLQNKRLLIVSDGALAYIPFSTLPEPTDANTTIPAIAEPLMVNHEIVNLPSASVLAVLRQQELGRKPAPNAVAVMADPVFDRNDPRVTSTGKMFTASAHAIPPTRNGQIATKSPSEDSLLDPPSSAGLLTRSAIDIGLSRNGQLSLPRLRFTRKEADEIMAVTPEGMGKKAVDFDATRAMATSPELSQYRILHFATHGLLDSAHPELSGLVFSMVDKNGRPQNGFLELQDIYNLNLPADLVVLSACETGLGKEISGEGLVGLTRGFMYAGASRVVASLWRVSDVGTAELMGAFYTAMEKDGLPPAAALRAAQIKLWKQKRWSDPYYWAAFQIQGEWK
jgi:CHAT domain-containing protein/Tfp pilus assembly protein PilF